MTPQITMQATNIMRHLFDKSKADMQDSVKTSIFDIDAVKQSNNDEAKNSLKFDKQFLQTHFSFIKNRQNTAVNSLEDAIAMQYTAALLYKLELEIARSFPAKLKDFRESETYKKYFESNPSQNIISLVKSAEECIKRAGDNKIKGLENINDLTINISSDQSAIEKSINNGLDNVKNALGNQQKNTIPLNSFKNNQKGLNNIVLAIGASNYKAIGSLMFAMDDRGKDGNNSQTATLEAKKSVSSFSSKGWIALAVVVVLALGAFPAVGAIIGATLGNAAIGSAIGGVISTGFLISTATTKVRDKILDKAIEVHNPNAFKEQNVFGQSLANAVKANRGLKNEFVADFVNKQHFEIPQKNEKSMVIQ